MKIWKKANPPDRAESSAGKPRKGRRIPIPKAIRILVAITLVLAVLISFVFWWDARNDDPGQPITRTTETTRFTATNAAKLDYKVHLTPNILYESSVLDAGNVYFSKLIDYIDTTASYEFSADQSAQLSGKYSATALLEGDNIPQKKFPITLGTPEGSLSFDHSATLDYVVFLKPNSLFTTTTLGPGEQYFANIVDHIAVSASYALQTSRLSESTGVYEVTALVRAEGYWEKSQTLVPKTAFDASAKSTAFSQPFDIDIEAFRQLAESVNDELGISTRKLELLIQFTINLHGKTEDTDAHDVLTSSMTIPLGSNVFTISGDLSEQRSGLFEPETAGAQQISFTSTGKGAAYTQNFKIDLTPYRETVQTIYNQTGVTVRNPRLRISFDVEATVVSEHGTIQDRLSPSMIIPLDGSTIEIEGNLSQSNPKSIKDTQTTTIPPPPKKGTGSEVIAIVIFAVLLVGFVTFTKNKPAPSIDPIEKEVASIQRKYGDHMVEATSNAPATEEKAITLDSIEGLDKIAEQLSKLIIHQYSLASGNSHTYYVLDGSTRYEYSPKASSEIEG